MASARPEREAVAGQIRATTSRRGTMSDESIASVELFLRDLPDDYLQVTASIEGDTLQVFTHDISTAAEEAYGDEDHETWLTIESGAWPALLLALLKEHFGGDAEAERKIAELCERNGIPAEREFWA